MGLQGRKTPGGGLEGPERASCHSVCATKPPYGSGRFCRPVSRFSYPGLVQLGGGLNHRHVPASLKRSDCALRTLILCQVLHQALLDPVRWALQTPLTHRDKTEARGGTCPGSHGDRGGQPRLEFGWSQGQRAKPWHSPHHHCQYICQH